MAGARPDTWMPLYWGDYAKDTAHLSAAHHGAYLMLIKHYWVTGQPLPDDDAQLWRIACADSIAHWRKLSALVRPFFEAKDGRLHHGRIEEELQGAINITNERSKAGARGAAKRWGDHKPSDSSAMATPIAKPSQNDAPSQSPSPRKKDEAAERAREAPADDLEIPAPLDRRKPDDRGLQDRAFAVYQAAASTHAWPSADFLTSTRRFKLESLLRSHGLDGWKRGLDHATESAFLRNKDGSPKRWFGFDWLLDEDHFAKLLEGFYVERPADDADRSTAASRGIAAAFARRSIPTD